MRSIGAKRKSAHLHVGQGTRPNALGGVSSGLEKYKQTGKIRTYTTRQGYETRGNSKVGIGLKREYGENKVKVVK